MVWLTGFVLGIVGLAAVAVAAEWLVVAVGAVVVATRKSAQSRTDPTNPHNLERSFAADDVSDLRTRFAALLTPPAPADPLAAPSAAPSAAPPWPASRTRPADGTAGRA